MEILIALTIAYLIVAPDPITLTATRGLAGAARGGATGRVRRGGRGRTGSSSKSPSRSRAILDGWREGVTSARRVRVEGRDLWSRGSRIGGRVAGGAGSMAGGIRTTVRNRRHGDAGNTATAGLVNDQTGIKPAVRSWTGANLVRRVRRTSTGHHVDPDDPDNSTTPETPADDDPAHLSSRETPAAPASSSGDKTRAGHPAGPVAPTTDATTTTHSTHNRKATPMALAGTDLANLDEVAGEVKAAEAAMEELDTALTEFKKWAGNLPDRWSGTNWGTRGLDTAISGLADVVSALKGPQDVLEQLSAVRTEVQKARAVGEAAEAARASGDLSGFRAA